MLGFDLHICWKPYIEYKFDVPNLQWYVNNSHIEQQDSDDPVWFGLDFGAGFDLAMGFDFAASLDSICFGDIFVRFWTLEQMARFLVLTN